MHCVKKKYDECLNLKPISLFELLQLGIISIFLYKFLLKRYKKGGNGGGKSPPSVAPTIVSLTPEAYSITIVWTSLSELIASSYTIQRSLDGVNFTFLVNVPNSASPTLSYTDSMPALLPNTLYYYRINAQNEAGQGPFSAIASTTTLPPPPNTWVEKSSGTSGINWLQVVSNNNTTWIATSIAQIGGGPSGASKLKSTDNGETWTPLLTGLVPESLSISAAITFFSFSGTNRFLFLSRFLNNAYYSDNSGTSWSVGSGSLGTGSPLWNSVCYGNNTVIGCRSNGDGTVTSHFTRSLNNGANFAAVLGPVANLNLKSVCYGEPEISSIATPRFVSVGTSGSNQNVCYSNDGIGTTWTNTVISSSPILVISWNAVCFGNLKFVAVGVEGTNGYVMSSSDGVTWTAPVITFPGTNLNWSSVNFGNGYFVAVSSNATTNDQIMYSHNGVDWTLVTAPGTPANQWTYVNFSPGSNRWIASDQDKFMVVNV